MAHQLAAGVTLSASALQQIVVHAVESVDGARVRRPRRGVELTVADGRAHVELELAVQHGVVLPDAARAVQAAVADALRSMCGLEPDGVDVSVEELE